MTHATTAEAPFDVVICGGGLAGLTLARQLLLARADLRVAVIEKSERPLPVACHKVGESSVELGSHYLDTVLGLRPYLREKHLKKNGLRFFCGDSQRCLSERMEIGPQRFPSVPSYQLDRGILENDLRAMAEAQGVTLLEGCVVTSIELASADPGAEGEGAEGEPAHRIGLRERESGERRELLGRWVVDASGRLRILQRKLGLSRPSEVRSGASWFRVEERVRLEELVPAEAEGWHARDTEGDRWLSTNHLMGLGYWIWIIPLSSGMTSIGIVAEEAHHPFSTFGQEASALRFIEEHEPALFARIKHLPIADFLALESYSYSSAQVFSADRWACVGEAGLFVDPLYSPGTDFIALANTFTSELILDERSGRLDPARVEEANRLFIGWAEHAMRMLGNSGPTFVYGEVFGSKLWWDFHHYWAFLCQYYFRGLYRLPAEEHKTVRALGERFVRLNELCKRVTESWAAIRQEREAAGGGPGYERPLAHLPMFPSSLVDLHLDLVVEKTKEEAIAKIEADLREGEELVIEILLRALRSVGREGAAELGERIRLSEWELVVDPARLEADALPRRARVDRLPRVGRDLERALGREKKGGPSLSELYRLALGAEEVEPMPPIEELLPHRPPMLFLDALLEVEEPSVRAVTEIREDHILLEDGKVSPMLAIELFAQTAAALMGYRGRLKKSAAPESGALLGSRKLDLFIDAFRVGDRLEVRATEVWGAGALAQLQCELFLERAGGAQEKVAEGAINVAHGVLGPPDQ